jgi:hypothetical protein
MLRTIAVQHGTSEPGPVIQGTHVFQTERRSSRGDLPVCLRTTRAECDALANPTRPRDASPCINLPILASGSRLTIAGPA